MVAKIILEGFIEVPDSDLALVENELANHIELTKKEPGCIIFRVEKDTLNGNRFNVYEEFEDEQAFQCHQARVKSSPWSAVTKNVKRHYRISEK